MTDTTTQRGPLRSRPLLPDGYGVPETDEGMVDWPWATEHTLAATMTENVIRRRELAFTFIIYVLSLGCGGGEFSRVRNACRESHIEWRF